MQRTTFRSVLALFLLGLPLWGLGCGGAALSDRPATYPVTGTVTMNGQPLVGANLNFQLADGSRSAAGVTDSQGRYELTTFAAGDGALPGEYRVAITQYEQLPPSAGVSEDHPDYNPEAATVVAKNLLPSRFANPETSGLTATVTEGRTTTDFELSD